MSHQFEHIWHETICTIPVCSMLLFYYFHWIWTLVNYLPYCVFIYCCSYISTSVIVTLYKNKQLQQTFVYSCADRFPSLHLRWWNRCWWAALCLCWYRTRGVWSKRRTCNGFRLLEMSLCRPLHYCRHLSCIHIYTLHTILDSHLPLTWNIWFALPLLL